MIHALPGMGADHRMYPAPWQCLPNFIAHDWVRHSVEKTLANVARQMAETYNIRDGDILVGSSLGGMVACEITKIREISELYLIGSATHKEEVIRLLANLHPLGRIAPIEWIRFSAGEIPFELAQMFAEVDPSFIRAMCAAIFEWDGVSTSQTKIFRIHGKHDLVIPAPEKVDLLLDGGHLLSMSHAPQCIDFIKANSKGSITQSEVKL